jgi:hypothetical protein
LLGGVEAPLRAEEGDAGEHRILVGLGDLAVLANLGETG